MTYACPAWEFAADNHLLKLQRLQNKVLRTIGNFPSCTPVRNLHLAFKLPYLYDYIKNYADNKHKLYKTMKTQIFATLDKAKPDTGLNLAAVKHTTVQVTRLPL
jgi:hypothetical protein